MPTQQNLRVHTHTHTQPPHASRPMIYVFFFYKHSTPGRSVQVQQSATYSPFQRSERQTSSSESAERRSGVRRTGNRHSAQVPPWCRALPLICIFHSEVIRLHGGLYERLLKQHLTRRVLRSLFTHSHARARTHARSVTLL